MIYVGLDLSDDIKTFYENHNSSIDMPLFNTKESFNLLIFHKESKNFTTKVIENNKLSKFNNYPQLQWENVLYISEGDNHNKSKPIDLFVSFNLLNIKFINELPKLNHSMIFIPKKYIFIVGGGTNEVDLYNIEKN